MAVTSMMQRLLDNALTAKFAKSLKHSDLPEGWADNPEIVQLAEDAYSVMGTESPWFKAYEKAKGPTEKMYHGTPYGGFDQFKDESYFTPNRDYAEIYMNPSASSNRSYFTPATNPEVYEVFLASQRPFDTRKPVARNIFNREFFQKWGNGAPLSERGLPDWTDATDLLEFLGEREGKKFDSVILDEGGVGGYGDDVVWRGVSRVPVSPTQLKSTSNRGTFNPADPNIYKGLIPAVGAGGLLALMGPEEAEAATRSDYAKRILEKHEKGSKTNISSGDLEPYLYEQVKEQDPHAINEVLSSAHPIVQRLKNPGWSPAHTIKRVSEVMDSKRDGLVVKNWQEDTGAEDYAKNGILMPYKDEPTFTPYFVNKKGKIVFKTILPPTRGQLAKVNVGVEGGVPLISRELTDAEVKPSAQRLPVSVVTPTTGVIMPESLTGSNRKDGDFWPSMARQFGLGTRGVIEGLGTGATLGFGDPGRVIADFIGLPVPETDIERQRVGLNAGVTDALTTFAGGVGAAKMAANPVVRGVGMELADKPLLGAGIGGLLGLLTYDEED